MKKLLSIACMLIASVALAQAPDYPPGSPPRTVVKAEYFFDADPGIGNATAINLTPSTDISNFSANFPLTGSALTNGFHRLYIRTQDNLGRWSLTQSALFDNFIVPAYPASPGAPGNFVEAEYFIDTDPGVGLGRKIALPASGDVSSLSVLIDVSGLASGVHRFYIRAKDDKGRWSLTNYGLFDNAAQLPYPAAPAPAPPITQAEYYFDADPGFGNGTAITLPSSTDIANFSFDVPVSSLAPGRHTIYLRSRQNPWSMSAYAEFTFGSVLPVSFLYVKAEVSGEDGRLFWATGFEQNADRFEIEYSATGTGFKTLGKVQATNNSNGSSYQYRHVRPAAGVAYYRIKQVDKDGKAMYSKTVLLVFGNDKAAPFAFPNPARDRLNVVLPAANYRRMEIVGIDGRVVEVISLQAGMQATTISVSKLRAGKYFLRLHNNGKPVTVPFVKQ